MSLSSDSNTINALGIFGRLAPDEEKYFQGLEEKYSNFPDGGRSKDFFNHLTLVLNRDVPICEVSKYLDLLRELKHFLPLKIKISKVILIDEEHLALSFDVNQTKKIRDLATKCFPKGVIETHYTKVVWFVPDEKQEEVKKILKDIKEITFFDFKLVANKQNDENTIYSSSR
jgi:hypothetical protein